MAKPPLEEISPYSWLLRWRGYCMSWNCFSTSFNNSVLSFMLLVNSSLRISSSSSRILNLSSNSLINLLFVCILPSCFRSRVPVVSDDISHVVFNTLNSIDWVLLQLDMPANRPKRLQFSASHCIHFIINIWSQGHQTFDCLLHLSPMFMRTLVEILHENW